MRKHVSFGTTRPFLLAIFLSIAGLLVQPLAAHAELLAAHWRNGVTTQSFRIPEGRILLVYGAPKGLQYLGEILPMIHEAAGSPVLFYAGLTQAISSYPVLLKGRAVAHIEVVEPAWPEQVLTINLPKYASYEADELVRIHREATQIRALFLVRSPEHSDYRFVPPLVSARHGNRFGARRIINKIPRRRHTGADYHAAAGELVRSMAAGKVVLTGKHFFAGNSIFIDHGDGLLSMYFHLSKILVKMGDAVVAGSKIGEVGSTGRATGPHLHFGIRYRGRIIDPDELLDLATLTPKKGTSIKKKR